MDAHGRLLNDLLVEQRKTNTILLAILNQEQTMAIKDVQEWNDFIVQVSATRGVEASAVTAINNIADKLAALAAGAVSLADLKTAVAEQTGLLKDSATPLAAAIARDPDSAPPAA